MDRARATRSGNVAAMLWKGFAANAVVHWRAGMKRRAAGWPGKPPGSTGIAVPVRNRFGTDQALVADFLDLIEGRGAEVTVLKRSRHRDARLQRCLRREGRAVSLTRFARSRPIPGPNVHPRAVAGPTLQSIRHMPRTSIQTRVATAVGGHEMTPMTRQTGLFHAYCRIRPRSVAPDPCLTYRTSGSALAKGCIPVPNLASDGRHQLAAIDLWHQGRFGRLV